jgi:uncharacterized protein YdaU (DUF1376 family)
MSSPFMQLYVADYLGDTRHLTTEQHGAYLLLLMTMWRSDGCLPNDAKKLARIAGCSPSRWAKISEDVLEFFDVEGAVLTNPRLTLELEKASEKSIKRAVSGSQGGKAKALKDKGLAVANANGLPWHSSEPEPEEPPNPQGGEAFNAKPFAKALEIASSAGCAFPALVDRIHKAQPVVGGKRRSTAPDVQRALTGALKRGGMPSAIWAAIQNFYALPASTKDGGQYANGAAVVLNSDRWREFAAPAALDSAPAAATFDGPPELRARIVALKDDAFARRWLDHYCRWRPADRTILAVNATVAETLKAELAGYFAERRIRVEVAAANDGTQAKEERAA